MIIVAGWLRVSTHDRSAFLESSRIVVEAARSTPGCIDFSLTADLVDVERINVFEQWESVEAVEQFRGSGPSADQQAVIIDAHVEQHEIGSTIPLT